MDNPFLDQVRSFLAARGMQAYLVGGFVRDMLLGRQSNDIDIAVPGDAVALARLLADAVGGHFVLLDADNGIARVVSHDGPAYADLAALRDGDLRADLAARDFTINALALPLTESGMGEIVDMCGGQNDLQARRVRMVSDHALRDDPARLVRSVRFAAQLGFKIDDRTRQAARESAPLLRKVAAERVRDEFCKIMVAPGAWRNLRLLDDLKLLSIILPELDGLRAMQQPKQHSYDAFTHTLAVTDGIEETLIACRAADIAKRPAGPPHLPLPVDVLGPVAERVHAHVAEVVAADRTRLLTLKLGALLHDIAKPRTRTVDEDGETHFYNHPMEGVAMAEEALRRLRFSVREIHIVTTMIGNHMRPAQIASDEQVTNKAVYRYFRDCGAEGIDTLLLSLADHIGTRGPRLDPSAWWQHAQFTRLMMEHYFSKPEQAVVLPKLISGKDIMKKFDVAAGPRVGELLEMVREAQAAGEVRTRDEALALVQERLNERAEGKGSA